MRRVTGGSNSVVTPFQRKRGRTTPTKGVTLRFYFIFVSLSRKHFRDTINDFVFYRIFASLSRKQFCDETLKYPFQRKRTADKSIYSKTRAGWE